MKQKFFWTDTYLIMAEESFDEVFHEIYEEKFIDNIFDQHEATVGRDEWITAIAGDIDDQPRCEWLFSPNKIRDIFQSHFEDADIIELINAEFDEEFEI